MPPGAAGKSSTLSFTVDEEIREREEQSSWVQTISHMRPCCHGDNVCDLRRFDRSNFLSLKEWVITGAACSLGPLSLPPMRIMR